MHLDALLDDVFSAVKAADYGRLNHLSAMLETVLIPDDAQSLARAARRARDNATLLDATAKGLRAARRRVDALQKGQLLTTYDRSGQRRDHPAQAVRTHRL